MGQSCRIQYMQYSTVLVWKREVRVPRCSPEPVGAAGKREEMEMEMRLEACKKVLTSRILIHTQDMERKRGAGAGGGHRGYASRGSGLERGRAAGGMF